MGKINYLIASVALFFLMFESTQTAISQTIEYPLVKSQTDADWIQITPKGEEFTAALPEVPAVYSSWSTFSDFLQSLLREKRSRAYAASADGTVYVIMSFKGYGRDKGKPDKVIETFIEGIKKDFTRRSRTHKVDIVFEREVTSNGFPGKQYRASINDVVGVMRCYLAKDHIYLLEAIGSNESNLSTQKFFSSFALAKKSDGSSATISTPTSQLKQQDQGTNKVYSSDEVDRKALVVIRREAQYTEQALRYGVNGFVKVRAVLSVSGKVTNIEVVKGLPHGLSESAIGATREIKFVPAMKNGQPVSQYIQIDYAFSSYSN
jgi:TonB family protein